MTQLKIEIFSNYDYNDTEKQVNEFIKEKGLYDATIKDIQYRTTMSDEIIHSVMVYYEDLDEN